LRRSSNDFRAKHPPINNRLKGGKCCAPKARKPGQHERVNASGEEREEWQHCLKDIIGLEGCGAEGISILKTKNEESCKILAVTQ
jgi:hypothetical protein